MPRRTKTQPTNKEPVFTWAFRSSKPHGGQTVLYETRLEETGILRCNCPGWIFCPGAPGVKVCKHTRLISVEAKQFHEMFKKGQELPVLEDIGEARTGSSMAPVSIQTKIKHGRLIEL